MELVPSKITVLRYFVYLSLPRVSTYRIVSRPLQFASSALEIFQERDSPYDMLKQVRELVI